MVVKRRLLLISVVISLFLLSFELIVLQIIVRRSRPVSHPIWRTLYAVTTTALRADLSLFIADPLILSVIFEEKFKRSRYSGPVAPQGNGDPYCQVLCHGQKVTQLAAVGELCDKYKIEKLTLDLQALGYTILTLNEDSDVNNSLRDPLLLHVLVVDEKLGPADGHLIIITVFYEQVRGQWWRGDLNLHSPHESILYRQGIRNADLRFRDKSSLFAKSEVKAAIIDGMIINIPGNGIENFLFPEKQLQFVACNWTRAKEFESSYPSSDEDRELNRLFRLRVKRILTTVSHALEKMNIPFWLSSGTLLGFYRSCDVIHYGHDVDIGIAIQDLRSDLTDRLMMSDLMLLHVFGKVNDSFELSFRNEDTKLDIFFFYNETDHVWNGGSSTTTGFKYKYSFPHFSLCWTVFLGLKVRIPCHSTREYIEANYGKEWFHPVREWDWKTSPPNVAPNGQWLKDEWNQVMQTFTLPYVKK